MDPHTPPRSLDNAVPPPLRRKSPVSREPAPGHRKKLVFLSDADTSAGPGQEGPRALDTKSLF